MPIFHLSLSELPKISTSFKEMPLLRLLLCDQPRAESVMKTQLKPDNVIMHYLGRAIAGTGGQ